MHGSHADERKQGKNWFDQEGHVVLVNFENPGDEQWKLPQICEKDHRIGRVQIMEVEKRMFCNDSLVARDHAFMDCFPPSNVAQVMLRVENR